MEKNQTETKQIEIIPKKNNSRGKTSYKEQFKRDKKIAKLSAAGLASIEIARVVGVSEKTVKQKRSQLHKLISGLKNELKNREKYTANKSELLDAVELKTLRSLSDNNKILNSSAKDLATIFTKIYNANRLEQGKSTSNSSVSFTVQKVSLRDVKK